MGKFRQIGGSGFQRMGRPLCRGKRRIGIFHRAAFAQVGKDGAHLFKRGADRTGQITRLFRVDQPVGTVKETGGGIHDLVGGKPLHLGAERA